MRRNRKIISIALAMVLILNLAGIDVAAGESANTGESVSLTESKEQTDKISEEKNEVLDSEDSTKTGEEDIANDTTDGANDGSSSVESDGGNNAGNEDSDKNGSTAEEGLGENTGEQTQKDTSLDALQADTEISYLSDLKMEVTGMDSVKLTWDIDDSEIILSGFDVRLYTDEKLEESSLKKEVSVEIEENQKTAQAEVNELSAGTVYYAAVIPYSLNGSGEKEEMSSSVIRVLILSSPTLSASAADGKVTLKWSEISGADSYEVYQISGSNRVHLETVTGKTSYTHSVSKNNVTYKYVVAATAAGTDEAVSNEVSATPRTVKPGKVTSFTIMDGEKSAILTWSKASNATSYYVYRYNSSKKRWDMVKQTTGTSYTNKSLSAGKTYKYRIAAVRTNLGETVLGDQTSTVSVSIKKSPGTTVRTIGYKAVVKSRAPIFTGKSSKKKVKYLKVGTKITTINYGNGRYQFKLNGKTYWISKDRLRFTASIWTTKDYSTKVKTDFVNNNGYKSSTKYLIWINQYTQRVMIYTGKKGNWKLVRSCRCATGTHLHMTPKGKFKITYKEKGWFYRTTYEKPIVHFKGANSFHSRIKNYKGGYADATIGRPKSKGCVRLYDKDINYIYKKCPKGTTVISH